MNFLFVHQNFPGQYCHLAQALQQAGHVCLAIGGPTARELQHIPLHRLCYERVDRGEDIHPWVKDLQIKCQRAEAVARQAFRLRQQGLRPDLIIGHPGWGELLAIKDVFPSVPVLHQLEFVYQLHGADTGFDPEFMQSPTEATDQWQLAARLRLRRVPQLLALHDLDHAIAPTQWQASTAPECFADRISVIHEGIDTQRIHPDPQAHINFQAAGLTFRPGDELVSFVARNLEPYRGFHVFMRMLPLLLARRPKCHVVIVGANGVSYGSPPLHKNGNSWRRVLLQELNGQLDLSRIHFVGRVPHSVLHNLFQVTACHVYLTYPFVLSWSVLEAMSCGALVVGSATPPVEEVIKHGVNGLLVDFFDHESLAAQISTVLADRGAYAELARLGRATVEDHFDLQGVCLPKQLRLVRALAQGQSIR